MPIPCVFLPVKESTIGSMQGRMLPSLFCGSGASRVGYPFDVARGSNSLSAGPAASTNWQETVVALLQKPFMQVHYFLQRTAGNCARRTLDARF